MITEISLIFKKIKTINIKAAMQKIANENGVELNKLFLNVISSDTLIKTVSLSDFVLYNEDIKGYYSDKEKMINEHIELKQSHTLVVKDVPLSPISLKYTIEPSNNYTHPSIIIYPESKIPYQTYEPKELYRLLLNELNNIKAYNGFLINLFDSEFREKLKSFVKYIYAQKFDKKIKLPLFSGIEAIAGDGGTLMLYYKDKPNQNPQFIEVEENEILAEYIKPSFGQKGFNAYGKIVDANSFKKTKDLEYIIDKTTIDIMEDDEKKIYKSKTKGFVNTTNNTLSIDNKIRLQKLSRVQDKVSQDESNNIEVVISQSNSDLDSVGEGVNLVSESVHISGHIGAKSTIKALNLVIDGATHQDSIQEAKFATINRHKGKLRCHDAKIALLEGGEISATNVEVRDVLNGTIRAENVTIGRVKNNLKVYASSSIIIDQVLGEDNIFKISYKDVPTLMSKLSFLQRDMEDLKYMLDEAKKHSPQKIEIINKQIDELKAKMREITECAFSAKIDVKNSFRGINTIAFVLSSGEEILYKTSENMYSTFYIEKKDDYIVLHPTTKQLSKAT